ncbi:T9SS type A sorting domain-containing protein [Flavobacterium sp. RHBU_24]|uniref:T9SS type A sorting domain-containing protein n=1 Tax=Flavobacterium sp. RHBU_24 TaxID=3391185 RepID=UPI003984800B
MKKHLCILLLSSFSAFAQLPGIAWQNTYGGTGSDGLFCTTQTADGGYITSGTAYSADGDITQNFGESDGWVAKLDETGAIEWQKSYGGSLNEQIYKILQTPDGGYIFAGYSDSVDGEFSAAHGTGDIWVAKIDAAGTVQWQQLLGGGYYDWANDITIAADGGFVVAGHSQFQDGEFIQQNVFIVKLDTQGAIVWQKSYGGSLSEVAYGIENTTDGGYIIAGATQSNDGDVTGFHYTEEEGLITLDAWILKLDGDGNLQWQKALGGYQDDMAFTIKQTADGGYITAAQTTSYNGDVTQAYGSYDYWIVKLDASGAITWQKSLGGNGYDEAHGVTETADGYIVGGMTYSLTDDVTANYGGGDVWLVKLGLSGAMVWEKNFGGTLTDYAYDIYTNTEGNFIVTGYTHSADMDVTDNYGNGDGWILNIAPDALGLVQNVFTESLLSPNPASDTISLSGIAVNSVNYTITDISGRAVATGTVQESIDVKNLSAGIYLLTTPGGQRKKFIKK